MIVSFYTVRIHFNFEHPGEKAPRDMLSNRPLEGHIYKNFSREFDYTVGSKASIINLTLNMATQTQVSLPLPVLPEGWSGEKDFKAIGSISAATQRTIEPVGPHFLAHARRARHKRTFSEDDRIQAQENAKKVEDDDSGEISEPEDPMMLARDAKDWKVRSLLSHHLDSC